MDGKRNIRVREIFLEETPPQQLNTEKGLVLLN